MLGASAGIATDRREVNTRFVFPFAEENVLYRALCESNATRSGGRKVIPGIYQNSSLNVHLQAQLCVIDRAGYRNEMKPRAIKRRASPLLIVDVVYLHNTTECPTTSNWRLAALHSVRVARAIQRSVGFVGVNNTTSCQLAHSIILSQSVNLVLIYVGYADQ